jgi:hypothetical protein
MRTLAFAFIIAAGACSAVDDFSRFHFGSDGGGITPANDLAVSVGGGMDAGSPPDLTPPPAGSDLAGALPGFGDPCDVDCASPYTCSHLGSKDTMGICSRSCTTTNNVCAALGASCVTVEGTTLCMPNCGLTQTCRSDLTCCANKQTSLVGQCAPLMTDFCGKG